MEPLKIIFAFSVLCFAAAQECLSECDCKNTKCRLEALEKRERDNILDMIDFLKTKLDTLHNSDCDSCGTCSSWSGENCAACGKVPNLFARRETVLDCDTCCTDAPTASPTTAPPTPPTCATFTCPAGLSARNPDSSILTESNCCFEPPCPICSDAGLVPNPYYDVGGAKDLANCCAATCELGCECPVLFVKDPNMLDMILLPHEICHHTCCKPTCWTFDCVFYGKSLNHVEGDSLDYNEKTCCNDSPTASPTPLPPVEPPASCSYPTQFECPSGLSFNAANAYSTVVEESVCCIEQCKPWGAENCLLAEGYVPNPNFDTSAILTKEECCSKTCYHYNCSVYDMISDPKNVDSIQFYHHHCCKETCDTWGLRRCHLDDMQVKLNVPPTVVPSLSTCCEESCRSWINGGGSCGDGNLPDPESLQYNNTAGPDHPECCVSRCSRPGMEEDCVRVGLERCLDGKFASGDDCPDIPTVPQCLGDVKSADICECCKCPEHGTEPIWSLNENPQKYHCVDLPESVEDFFCSPKEHDGTDVKQCRVEKNNNFHCHMLPEYILDQREFTPEITDAQVDACCITHWKSGGEVKKPEDFPECCKGDKITC